MKAISSSPCVPGALAVSPLRLHAAQLTIATDRHHRHASGAAQDARGRMDRWTGGTWPRAHEIPWLLLSLSPSVAVPKSHR